MYANTWCTRCVPQFNQSRLTSVAIVLHDVRKRVLAELHLARCKQYFRGAFDNAPLGLALVTLTTALCASTRLCAHCSAPTPSSCQARRRSRGCFLYHQPMPTAQFGAWLAALTGVLSSILYGDERTWPHRISWQMG